MSWRPRIAARGRVPPVSYRSPSSRLVSLRLTSSWAVVAAPTRLPCTGDTRCRRRRAHKMIQTARAATRADVLILFPITSQPPAQDRFAVEIPEMEKRRASLDARVHLWMTLDEYNQDIIGQSFYLEREPRRTRLQKPRAVRATDPISDCWLMTKQGGRGSTPSADRAGRCERGCGCVQCDARSF